MVHLSGATTDAANSMISQTAKVRNVTPYADSESNKVLMYR